MNSLFQSESPRVASPWLDFARDDSVGSSTTNTSPFSISVAATSPMRLAAETDGYGHVEYKLKLDPSDERFEHLVTQLKWRLAEGSGEALYELGVADDGTIVGLNSVELTSTLEMLTALATRLSADVSIVRRVSIDTIATSPESPVVKKADTRQMVEALVRQRALSDEAFLDLRVMVVGSMHTGKSSLVSLLAYGCPDNGRGSARTNLLRHPHELESGHTSSIAHEVIGFTRNGAVVNYHSHSPTVTSWEDVCEMSSKVVHLLDTCGALRFLKTTLRGLVGHAPDYVCITVVATAKSLDETTKDLLSLCGVLGIPFFVTFTKVDLATQMQLQVSLGFLCEYIKSPPLASVPVLVQTLQEAKRAALGFAKAAKSSVFAQSNSLYSQASVVPIFLTSSVTPTGANILYHFFHILPKPISMPAKSAESLSCPAATALSTDATIQPSIAIPLSIPNTGLIYGRNRCKNTEKVVFSIAEVFQHPDAGTVIGGVLHTGRIEASISTVSTTYFLGPDTCGGFHQVEITGIHRQRTPVAVLSQGQAGTLAIRTLATSPSDMKESVQHRVRKGMVILQNPDPYPTACKSFEADVFVLSHSNHIVIGQELIVHSRSIRATCRVAAVTSGIATDGSTCAEIAYVDSLSLFKQHKESVRVNTKNDEKAKAVLGDSKTNAWLSTGSRGHIRFEFLNSQYEYLEPGQDVLLMHGKNKIVGRVVTA